MRVRWTPSAVADLQRISDYLEQHRPNLRDSTIRKLYGTINASKQSPWRGRKGREEDTREIMFPPMPYIAVYRTRVEAIEVLRIYHGAQERLR